jgi:SAM-dependent methyltransferase
MDPFLDPDRVRNLYRSPHRLAERTHALRTAKVGGLNPNDILVEAARRYARANPRLLEIGCGRGSMLTRMMTALNPVEAVALDASPAMLAATRKRVQCAVTTVESDFHHLPFPKQSFNLAVAAFCLYHSPKPTVVCAELSRCLTRGGVALLATKSADSYRELDVLVEASGLDPSATDAPSLYATFHSGNIEEVANTAFMVLDIQHEQHRFRFSTPELAAAYISTIPKYVGCEEPAQVASALRQIWPPGGLLTTSTVSIAVGRKR